MQYIKDESLTKKHLRVRGENYGRFEPQKVL